MDSESVGLAVDPSVEKFGDTSEAEIGLITKNDTRKRKHEGSQTDLSCSCSSSGTGSPFNIPYCLGFIGKDYIWATNESEKGCSSDGSRPGQCTWVPGYHSASTAVVSDSSDEMDFPVDLAGSDTFSVEFEPPETESGDDDISNSEDEQVVTIPSSSEEDPGADGGDECDIESDSDDSWECAECWTINLPLTTRCLMCWKERKFHAPLTSNRNKSFQNSLIPDVNVVAEPRKASNPTASDTKPGTNVHLDKIADSLSRSTSSCSSTQASSDSGICVSSCETDVHDCMGLSSVLTTSQRPLQIEPLGNEPSQNDTLQNVPSKNKHSANEGLPNDPSQDEVSKNEPSLNEPSQIAVTLHNEAFESCPSENILSQNEPLYTKANTSMLRKDSENTTSNNSTVIKDLNLCVICSVGPRNASIIHGSSGHQVCCIACAEKLKADKKRCPVCRRRIHLVIKNFL